MTRLYDISRAIHAEMAVWPGDPGFELNRTGKIADGSPVNVSALNLGAHTGTRHAGRVDHLAADVPGADAATAAGAGATQLGCCRG